MKVSYCIEILECMKQNIVMTDQQLAVIDYLKILLHSTFIKRSYKKSPNLPIKVKISDLSRVKDEYWTRKIIYILQLNESPLSFNQFLKLLHDRVRVTGAIHSLVKTGMIERIAYATYSLTEKGKNIVV